MSLRYLAFIFFLMKFGTGCSQYPVSGFIDMAGSDKYPVMYLIDPQHFSSLASSFEGKVLDSARIDNQGYFYFEKMPESNEKSMYLLAIQRYGEKYLNRLENDVPDSSNYIPFIFQPSDRITIKSSAQKLQKDAAIIGGSTENTEILNLIKERWRLYAQSQRQLSSICKADIMEQEIIRLQFQKSLIASIANNKNVFVNALALRWISPNGDYERIPELVKEVCQKISETQPDYPWTKQICQKLASLPLIPGDDFPDLPIPMKNGDTVRVYSILGKKLTLVDLWASWCAPCRHENRNTLVPLWDDFHNKGLQIIGYALDSDENGWKSAIDKDGADRWLHASHLKGDVSPLFEKLNLYTIPANYLLDEKGKIIAKNLHGEELFKQVSVYLK